MAMDFWEAQRRAKSRTSLFLTVFILLTLGIAAGAEYAMRYFAEGSYDTPYPVVGLLFLGITFGVAWFQYVMFQSYGGSYVAESVGAYYVDPANATPKEKQLLNIVEEIALAASLPIPPVYILEANQINAFAAGLTQDKAAITVTVGTLNSLTREELQGVIAHEFGHIYNGDMKISLRLAAMVMGFFFALYIGFRLLQVAGLRGGRSRDRGDQKGGNPIAIAAIILMVAGAITWFAGTLLQAMVSREREYLADACAVQFTRNPNGISGALRKIAGMTVNDMPKDGLAFSHLYFDDYKGIGAFWDTHPPIEKRIAAIEGRVYMPEEWKKDLPANV